MTSIWFKKTFQNAMANKLVYFYFYPVATSAAIGGIYGGCSGYIQTIPDLKNELKKNNYKTSDYFELYLSQTLCTMSGCYIGTVIGAFIGMVYPITLIVTIGNIYVRQQVDVFPPEKDL